MSKSCAPYKYEEIWDNNDATYSHATHYTYDIHGNVNTLLQDNPNTGVAGQEFKRLDYAYDLISGNVNEVVYQEGQLDMMIHRYEYDSDNRITSVETSTDGVFFDNDAKYFYYAHGPLARTELGENQVQGLDYVYTLQGWIKGVNSNTLDTTRDVGQDGNRVVGNPNAYFAKDVFGYTLNYFAGDYNAINSTVSQTPNNFEADKTNSDLLTSRKDFFNGNISAMVTTITNPTTGEVLPQGMAYDYDQLNRLLSAKAFVNLDMQTNTWQSGSTYANRYFNAFTYDANGNILTQTRYAENGTQIEDLTYQYNRNTNGKMLQNRLYHVNDNVAATAFTDDIDDQGTFSNTNHNNTNNYSYDGEGRLVRDDAEEIASITWTVTGKVKEVIRTSGSTKKNLKFRYDAMGQRIAKEVYDAQNNWEKTTYYVRDPQGNVMGIYEKKNDAQTQQLSYKIAERYIYGSSDVGLITNETELISANNPSGSSFVHIIGEKTFYKSNHLGNLLSTVSDKIIAHDWDNDLIVDYYRAEILSSTDFSGFGVKLDGRNFVVKKPRVDFNGKETDEETEWQDYGMRMYEPLLGRFLSIDPLASDFPQLTTYQFASNIPIRYIDLDGAEADECMDLGKNRGNPCKPKGFKKLKVQYAVVETVTVQPPRQATVNATGGPMPSASSWSSNYPSVVTLNAFGISDDILIAGTGQGNTFQTNLTGVNNFNIGPGSFVVTVNPTGSTTPNTAWTLNIQEQAQVVTTTKKYKKKVLGLFWITVASNTKTEVRDLTRNPQLAAGSNTTYRGDTDDDQDLDRQDRGMIKNRKQWRAQKEQIRQERRDFRRLTRDNRRGRRMTG